MKTRYPKCATPYCNEEKTRDSEYCGVCLKIMDYRESVQDKEREMEGKIESLDASDDLKDILMELWRMRK